MRVNSFHSESLSPLLLNPSSKKRKLIHHLHGESQNWMHRALPSSRTGRAKGWSAFRGTPNTAPQNVTCRLPHGSAQGSSPTNAIRKPREAHRVQQQDKKSELSATTPSRFELTVFLSKSINDTLFLWLHSSPSFIITDYLINPLEMMFGPFLYYHDHYPCNDSYIQHIMYLWV